MAQIIIGITGSRFNPAIAASIMTLGHEWKEMPQNVKICGTSAFAPMFSIDVRNMSKFDEEWLKQLVLHISTCTAC